MNWTTIEVRRGKENLEGGGKEGRKEGAKRHKSAYQVISL